MRELERGCHSCFCGCRRRCCCCLLCLSSTAIQLHSCLGLCCTPGPAIVHCPCLCCATCVCRAVAEKYRRRGLGRLLLEACERAAVQCSPPATLMALVVYRYNDPGKRTLAKKLPQLAVHCTRLGLGGG